MKLLTFAASHRKESINRKLVKVAAKMAEKAGATIDFAEYGSFDMPLYDDETYDAKALPAATKQFVSQLQAADGLLLASPEYNWSFPGSLKNIIDWASASRPNPFVGKTALLLSASPSLRGGAQGLMHLQVPLMHLGAFVFPQVFTLSRAEEAFGDTANFKDEKLTAELSQLVSNFVTLTASLKRS